MSILSQKIVLFRHVKMIMDKLSLPSEERMFRNSIWDHGKIKFCVCVTSIFYSFKARGLKVGMQIYLNNAVKLVGQNFKFLFRSLDN